MKLPGLIIDISLILILTPRTKGQKWDINVTKCIRAVKGSDVTIPCSFTYPPEHYTKDVKVYWKKNQRSEVRTDDRDLNVFVCRTNDTFVHENYRGKTKLIGNKDKGNCTLLIQNIEYSEQSLYVRVIAKGNQISFLSDFVSITLSDENGACSQGFTALPSLESSVTVGQKKLPASIYMAIFVPVVALVLIFLAGGIFFRLKCKRTMSLTRENSGYYANFNRTSSYQAKRDATLQKQENKKLSEVTAIDEPVYLNVEAPPVQMDERAAHTDSIYENVFYLK